MWRTTYNICSLKKSVVEFRWIILKILEYCWTFHMIFKLQRLALIKINISYDRILLLLLREYNISPWKKYIRKTLRRDS